MPKNYNVIKLNMDAFYENGTKPEGIIFALCKKLDKSIPKTWVIAHWQEIFELLIEKYLKSENEGNNCGVIPAARAYFSNHYQQLFNLTQKYDLSLPELSLIIKQDGENKIFIPNMSIAKAKQGIYAPHKTLESFFASDSFNLIRMIAQNTAANPDSSLPHEKQTINLYIWLEKYGEKAKILLENSLEFHPSQIFVEGQSPDITLKNIGHLPYEEIAQEVTLKKTLEETVKS